MSRILSNFKRGTLSATISNSATTVTSAEFAALPTVSSPDYLAIVIDPAGTTPEIVHATHTAASTSLTIVRAQEGTSATAHNSGVSWLLGALAQDFTDRAVLAANQTFTGINTYNAGTFLDKGNEILNARAFGALLDGTTDDTAAVQSALNAARAGDIVWVEPTLLGCKIDGQLVVPKGVRLLGNVAPGTRSRFNEPSVTGSSVPGNSTIIVTSTSLSPVVLLTDATCDGFNFFYPNQNWGITSLAASFNTYPAAVQFGNAANPNVNHPVARRINLLGASHGFAQYATDGTPISCPTIEDIGGWVLGGSFLRLNKTNDVSHARRLHLSPNDLTAYAAAKGADTDVFTAIGAKTSTMFHLGAVDDIRADGFGFGFRTGVLFDDGMFTGDTAAGFGGKFDLDIDLCYRAYHCKRGSNAFPVRINGWYTPMFRPNGSAGDAANQAFLHLEGAAVATTRWHCPSIRVTGTTNDAVPSAYSGQADQAFTASSVGANNRVMVGLGSFDNLNTQVVADAAVGIVTFSQQSVGDAAPTSTTDGARLARTAYRPASPTALSGNTTFAVADATNLSVTFRAPNTGAVEVTLEGMVRTSAAGNLGQWGLFSGGSLVTGTGVGVTRIAEYVKVTTVIAVTGLTPGTSYTWAWAHVVSVGTLDLIQGGDYGPSVMTVRKAS